MNEQYGESYTIPAGTVVMLSKGSYSDYEWVCLARAKWDVDIQAVMRKWEVVCGSRFPSTSATIAWLVGRSGYFEELPRPMEWNVEYMTTRESLEGDDE